MYSCKNIIYLSQLIANFTMTSHALAWIRCICKWTTSDGEQNNKIIRLVATKCQKKLGYDIFKSDTHNHWHKLIATACDSNKLNRILTMRCWRRKKFFVGNSCGFCLKFYYWIHPIFHSFNSHHRNVFEFKYLTVMYSFGIEYTPRNKRTNTPKNYNTHQKMPQAFIKLLFFRVS